MSFRGWVAIIGLVVLLVFWLVLAKSCADRREAEADARVARESGKAQSASGRDAIEVITKNAEEAAKEDDLRRETEEIIRATKGADREVTPELDTAIRRRVCLRVTYRCTAPCEQLLGACSR